MMRKSSYSVPVNVKLFKSNYDYFNGIGKLTQAECIDRSLHVSGAKKVDFKEYEDYIESNQLLEIFKLHN